MRKQPFLDCLNDHVLLCDGAMGTMLYERGVYINRCFDELNISNFGLIKQIHLEYIQAGADIIETNTFGANRLKLSPHGFKKKVKEINYEGARIARAVAQDQVYVAGSIGPLGKPVEPFGSISQSEARSIFLEQAEGLVQGGVDLFMLETFGDINEIRQAILAIREICDKPIVAHMTFRNEGVTLMGVPAETAAISLDKWGADVIGANCGVGPQPVFDAIQRISTVTDKKISAQPNSGEPKLIDGRVIYMTSPEYYASYAKRFLRAGVSLIGGCCGTSPEHIRRVRAVIKAIRPTSERIQIQIPKKSEILEARPTSMSEKSELARKVSEGRFVVSVELVPPRGLSTKTIIKRAARLKASGVDAVNIPDGPRATARMTPMATALLIKKQIDIEVLLHYCCRDRNLLGMQSDLLGMEALNLRNILVITGDPPKLGDYPDATAVFDIDSIGLTRMVSRLNHGLDIAGNSIGRQSSFFVGVGANPAAIDFDREVDRFHQKVEAGAEFALTQPVYKTTYLQRFLERIQPVKIPILVGILPLVSYRNAEFLHNEVPGMAIPDDIRHQMSQAGSGKQGRDQGVKIARDALIAAKDMVQGVYIMLPMGRLEMALEVLEAV
ncbi:MAG: bifunctional homocysteine S-methyltransferase/methylenetetrahydrofolate reductase [Candidatus Cloacimonetes bacterium 4572_55]|nr:MAG: bifunctional homocysteine S-methyltransferase/methylenetetrahydrofolate reductase [Candidatus Cloacimonetes bacterium 4572_55]